MSTESALPLLPLLLLLLLARSPRGSAALTTVDHHPDDEYLVQHQVDQAQAYEQARQLELFPGPIAGCKPCTSAEMRYCQDGSVIEDHCCCDGNYNEVFGFVSHICRVGPEACRVRAADCAEYTRLRDCCCRSYLASLWKYMAGGASLARMSHPLLGLAVLLVILGAVR